MRGIVKEVFLVELRGLIRQLTLTLCLAFSVTSLTFESEGEEEKEENGGGGERIPDPLPGLR